MGEIDERGFGRWCARSAEEEELERLVRGLTYQDGWTFVLSRSTDAGAPTSS